MPESLSCALTALMTHFAVDLQTSITVMLACIPHLLIYPLLVSSSAHRLIHTARQQKRQIAALARVDALSGLLNRGHWEELALHQVHRFRRSGLPAALLMLDIDHFKEVNDRHGHHLGDVAIRKLGGTIGSCIREADCAGRYGGDEFAIVLPEVDQAEAMRVAQRIVDRVRAIELPCSPPLQLSVSIGVATLDAATADLEGWLNRADLALYAAKNGGRNRAELAPAATP